MVIFVPAAPLVGENFAMTGTACDEPVATVVLCVVCGV
jgi:hypothetical protein